MAEYERKNNTWAPCFALSAQIGNPDYIDADGDMLSEDEWYMLYNHKFTKAILADEILLIKKSCRKAGELTVYKTEQPYEAESDLKYVIFDGENYSHGKTIKEAKESLKYKIADRDKSDYNCWINNLELVVTKEEVIKGYRVITGACEAGTRSFVANTPNVPDKMTLLEALKMTDGQYGNEAFRRFLSGCSAEK